MRIFNEVGDAVRPVICKRHSDTTGLVPGHRQPPEPVHWRISEPG